ncbi:hypothetical protein ASPBRDRAFT_407163 [Aspergillus brasiliensis CBS 101740]|uniref:Uncharacterized protein n=1 Tax=Aspergillus brasiliensis (strain CBS 101740 / IMI 381727 / IBT 21946) TaxID=767769 RepID=A0A1L9UXE9_ASPBC|nr:hypothetical protein ASPBRDRAFT_407163 [Aspergillus brasiliensis CBS 101740]
MTAWFFLAVRVSKFGWLPCQARFGVQLFYSIPIFFFPFSIFIFPSKNSEISQVLIFFFSLLLCFLSLALLGPVPVRKLAQQQAYLHKPSAVIRSACQKASYRWNEKCTEYVGGGWVCVSVGESRKLV